MLIVFHFPYTFSWWEENICEWVCYGFYECKVLKLEKNDSYMVYGCPVSSFGRALTLHHCVQGSILGSGCSGAMIAKSVFFYWSVIGIQFIPIQTSHSHWIQSIQTALLCKLCGPLCQYNWCAYTRTHSGKPEKS